MFLFSKKSLDVIKTVDGRLQALIHVVLAHSKYDFGVPSTGGIRTAKEQNALYKKGWSKLDGYNKKSYHQSGYAIDIAIYDEHGLCYKCKDKYEEISRLFIHHFNILKHLKVFPENSYIRWGGDWNMNDVRVDKDPNENFLDLPHFEIRNM